MTAIHAAISGAYFPVAAAAIVLSDQTVGDSTLDGSTAFASYELDNAGVVQNQNSATLETWLVGAGSASAFEARATLSSGVSPSGTMGTWLNLGTDRSWSLSNSLGDGSTKTSVITVEIRDASSPYTIRDSATITITATSDNLTGGLE